MFFLCPEVINSPLVSTGGSFLIMTSYQTYTNYIEFVIKNSHRIINNESEINIIWGGLWIANIYNGSFYIKFSFNCHLYEIFPWERNIRNEDNLIRNYLYHEQGTSHK